MLYGTIIKYVRWDSDRDSDRDGDRDGDRQRERIERGDG